MLLEAAQKPGTGFTWCNETTHTVMAAIGIEERNTVTTRGWYRVDAGKCVRPEIMGQPKRLYSFAEAVDAMGQAIRTEQPAAGLGRRHHHVHAADQVRAL